MNTRRSLARKAAAFTRVDALGVLMLLGLLGLLALPALGNGRTKSQAVLCLANLRRLDLGMHLYTEDHAGVFPAHRAGALADESPSTNWWGITLRERDPSLADAFRCPALEGRRTDYGVRWAWAFDMHRVGYGYNAFFLGLHPYSAMVLMVGGVRFASEPWFNRSAVLHPSESLLLGESTPGPDLRWSSSLWWPTATMDPKASSSQGFEGVATDRHTARGMVAFNDGHVEPRADPAINPAGDPNLGSVRGLVNSRFWDPRQQAGER